MNIKVLFFDFDRTTLQQDGIYISLRNMHALREAMKKGILCIPCTGRSQDMFPPQIEAEEGFRYWVSASGCRIVDRKKNQVIYKGGCFTPEQGAGICRVFEGRMIYGEIAAGAKIYMESDVNDALHLFPVPPHHVWYVLSKRQVPVIGKLSDYILENRLEVEKINLYGVPDEYQDLFMKQLESMDFISFQDSTPNDMQFTSVTLDKPAAIQVLLDHLGLTFENVMSIGDSTVMDGCIMEKAALGIAVGNAPKELKDIAKYVVSDYDKDGLAEAIEKYLLLDS